MGGSLPLRDRTGEELQDLADEKKTAENKVQGCASQVWLATDIDAREGKPIFKFVADSDAHIVRGLIAILSAIYDGQPLNDVPEIDPDLVFEKLGLKEHLTPQRSNGLASMVARIRSDASAAAGQAL